MPVTPQMYLIVCPLIFLAGIVDSAAGGGGLISLPAYYLAGLSPVLAAGTNKLSACCGTAASLYRYVRGGTIDWRCGLAAAAAALPGSLLGTELLKHIPEQYVRIVMIVLIPVIAAVVLLRGRKPPRRAVPAKHTTAVAAAIGFTIGFYDGLVGPGTGTFLIILFTMTLGMEAVTASGTAKIVNFASNLVSMASLLASGHTMAALAIPAALFGIAGNWIGASVTLKRGSTFIRRVMLAVLVLLLAKMIDDVL